MSSTKAIRNNFEWLLSLYSHIVSWFITLNLLRIYGYIYLERMFVDATIVQFARTTGKTTCKNKQNIIHTFHLPYLQRQQFLCSKWVEKTNRWSLLSLKLHIHFPFVHFNKTAPQLHTSHQRNKELAPCSVHSLRPDMKEKKMEWKYMNKPNELQYVWRHKHVRMTLVRRFWVYCYKARPTIYCTRAAKKATKNDNIGTKDLNT